MNISSNNTLALSIIGILMLGSLSNSAAQERIFENKIPAHIPIKIKIKKEKEESFKDLKNEKWLREFELEVTNTGDRPIYYLDIAMGTEVRPEGLPEIVISVRYGRWELGDIVTKATYDDVPIKPGETIILTAREMVANWERFRRDGTGYWATELYPPPKRSKRP